MSFSIIVAIDQKGGIGKNNTIPWHLSQDLKYFAKVTKHTSDPEKKNALIMGSNTWRSLPDNYRPLPDRLNVVLSRKKRLELPESVGLFNSFDKALKELKNNDSIENIFVIGGGELYTSIIEHPECTIVYVTHIHKDYKCDTFFPVDSLKNFTISQQSDIHQSGDIRYTFYIYKK